MESEEEKQLRRGTHCASLLEERLKEPGGSHAVP